MLSALLGPDWSVEAEFEKSRVIAKRLDDDAIARFLSIPFLGAIFVYFGFTTFAYFWCAALLLQEFLSLRVEKLHKTGPDDIGLSRLHKLRWFITKNVLGAVIWAFAAPTLWMSQDPLTMVVGAAVLLGTIIHNANIYSVSRLQIILNVAPGMAASFFLLATIFSFDAFVMSEKYIIAACFAAVPLYTFTVIRQNVMLAERYQKAVDQTKDLALRDPLTKLLNRRGFLQKLEHAVDSQRLFAIGYIDLDRFKPVNDQMGHAIGDAILVEISRRLEMRGARSTAARIGGDEFALLIDIEDSEHDVEADLKELYHNLADTILTPAGPVNVGVSIGYARSSVDGQQSDDLLNNSDVAMRRAKANGGGVQRFDSRIDLSSKVLSAVELSFRDALMDGKIRAALQPIIRAENGEIEVYELLARWVESGFTKDPGPDVFIPIAERQGLLNKVLWTTLEQALPVIKQRGAKVAINLSPSQLLTPRLLERMKHIATKHGISESRIEFEITERVAFRNVDENVNILARAREMGFSIVMDDFGTGYTSLSILGKLPLDKLKIDRSFLLEAFVNENQHRILKAAVALVNEMKISSCVEGVENAELLAFAEAIGFDYIQGYFFGVPEIVSDEQAADRLAV